MPIRVKLESSEKELNKYFREEKNKDIFPLKNSPSLKKKRKLHVSNALFHTFHTNSPIFKQYHYVVPLTVHSTAGLVDLTRRCHTLAAYVVAYDLLIVLELHLFVCRLFIFDHTTELGTWCQC